MKKIQKAPTSIESSIEVLKRQYGNLSPNQLLDFARPQDSPIHEYFDWDDNEAAEKFRMMQAAKYLMLKITIIRSGQKEIQLKLESAKNYADNRRPFIAGHLDPKPIVDSPGVLEEISVSTGIKILKKFLVDYQDWPSLINIIDADALQDLDAEDSKNNPLRKRMVFCQNGNCNKRREFELGTGKVYKNFNVCSDACVDEIKITESSKLS